MSQIALTRTSNRYRIDCSEIYYHVDVTAYIAQLLAGFNSAHWASERMQFMAELIDRKTESTGKNRMREVAKLAGVSNATVSRVLNNTPVKIAHETRMRVQRVADEIGYKPNRAARTLATGRTNTIGFCVINLHSTHTARTISSALGVILPNQYDTVISEVRIQQDGNIDSDKLRSLPVDGLIFLDVPRGTLHSDVKVDQPSHLDGRPFVDMGVFVLDSADYVRVDLYPGVLEVLHHLHKVGSKRIAMLLPDWIDHFKSQKEARLRGYEEVMAEIGQKPELILTPDAYRKSAGPALKSYIERHGCPDGLFCFNDEMAVGALKTLRDMGYDVPGDVAIAACDGIDEMAFHSPAVTTIEMPMQEMCERAWEFLQQRIRHPDLPLQQITMQPQVVVRGSSMR